MLSKDLSNNSPSGSISITTKASPIIKTKTQSNPGLSFFCQPIVSLSKPTKTKATQPMVVSRINLPISRPKEEEEEVPISKVSPAKTSGIGTFMLRGLLFPQKALDEAKVHRRIEDLEIEKNSLLTLNQTLETVVKEQTNTIIDLQKRLAAIERPLTPGLDTTSSKNGIMSCSEKTEGDPTGDNVDDDEAAFERIRLMLLQLIQQAQSAVLLPSPTSPDNSANRKSKVIRTPSTKQIRSISITTPPTSPIPTKRPPSLYKSNSKSSINSVSSNLSKRSVKTQPKQKNTKSST
ncbi:hypothetical protein G6F57_007242 [Rhizopus arrhizus]|nr:hypothetical protein G6F27_002863 [Rhizopus arrhizus]KAG1406960.1 hypothetical protein G6F58_009737 [Rhizopus delemar]KAG1020776.1 hypothetical protein G6F26_009007 [Rhizopus arrhizus]KAG1039658.1 hypothetical protein G6F25_005394 [Rhizopus arrhizus]KAG1066144.1 hypothetical protein G6F41_008693 [Rhizopus arrhizus]